MLLVECLGALGFVLVSAEEISVDIIIFEPSGLTFSSGLKLSGLRLSEFHCIPGVLRRRLAGRRL